VLCSCKVTSTCSAAAPLKIGEQHPRSRPVAGRVEVWRRSLIQSWLPPGRACSCGAVPPTWPRLGVSFSAVRAASTAPAAFNGRHHDHLASPSVGAAVLQGSDGRVVTKVRVAEPTNRSPKPVSNSYSTAPRNRGSPAPLPCMLPIPPRACAHRCGAGAIHRQGTPGPAQLATPPGHCSNSGDAIVDVTGCVIDSP